MGDTNWKEMDHVVPDEYEKFTVMLAEACSAKNSLILVTRFQKIVVAIKNQAEVAGMGKTMKILDGHAEDEKVFSKYLGRRRVSDVALEIARIQGTLKGEIEKWKK